MWVYTYFRFISKMHIFEFLRLYIVHTLLWYFKEERRIQSPNSFFFQKTVILLIKITSISNIFGLVISTQLFSRSIDPKHCICLEVLILHGYELRLFWAKLFPIHILLILQIWHSSNRFNVLSYDLVSANIWTNHLPDNRLIYYMLYVAL